MNETCITVDIDNDGYWMKCH